MMMEASYKELYGKEYQAASEYEKILWADAWNAALKAIHTNCRLMKCTVEGVDYFMSCWAGDKDKPGAPSLTIKFQKADAPKPVVQSIEMEDLNDIPF